jgi:hypothetical protein
MPTIADLRRYEDEGVAPAPATPVAPTQTSPRIQQRAVPVATAAPRAPRSSDEIWRQWLGIRQDVTEQTSGWWESPDEYPQEVIQRASTVRPAPVPTLADRYMGAFTTVAPAKGSPLDIAIQTQQQKQTKTGVYGYVAPKPEAQKLSITWGDWFKKQAATVSQGVASIIESPPEDSTRFGAVANYLFGNPFGNRGQRGVVLQTAGKVFTDPAYYERRLAGYASNMWGAQLATNTPGLQGAMFDAGALYKGTLVADTEAMFEQSNATDEEVAAQVQRATERTAYYEERKKLYLSQGRTASTAHSKAFSDVGEKFPIERVSLAPIFETTEEGDVVLSEKSVAAYTESAGYRYTWGFDDQAEARYWDDRAAGMSPVDAAIKNENPVIEQWGTFINDPNWFLGADNFVMGVGTGAVKGAAKALGFVGSKIPIVNRGLVWAAAVNAKTLGNRAANAAKTMLHAAASVADQADEVLTPDVIRRIVTTPPPEVLKVSRQVTEAFAKSADAADSILKAVDAAFAEGMSDEALTAIRKELSHGNLGVTDEVVEGFARRRAFETAVTRGASAAHAFALDAFVSLEPGLEKIIRAKTPFLHLINNATSTAKATLVDLWLGTRPAWNVFNYVDNTIKLMLDGSNPFASLPNLATKYANVAPEMGYAIRAISELRSIPFWRGGAETNKRYVELLYSVLPPQAIGGFAQHVGVEGERSLIRKIPGLRTVSAWNNSVAERIEASARARLYFSNLDKYVTKARTAMVDRVVKSMVDGVLQPLGPEAAKALRQRLNRLDGLPTVADVERIFRDIVTEDGRTVITNIGEEFGDALANLPTEQIKAVQASLGQLVAGAARSGSGRIPTASIDKVFNDAAQAILRTYDEQVEAATRAISDSLPKYGERVEDFVERLYDRTDLAFRPFATRDTILNQGIIRAADPEMDELRKLGWTYEQARRMGQMDAYIVVQNQLPPPVRATQKFLSHEAQVQKVLNLMNYEFSPALADVKSFLESSIERGTFPPGTTALETPEAFAEYIVDNIPEAYIDRAVIFNLDAYKRGASMWTPEWSTISLDPVDALVIHEYTHVMDTVVKEKLGAAVADSALGPIRTAVLNGAPALTATAEELALRPQWWYPVDQYQELLRRGRSEAFARTRAGEEALAEAMEEYMVRPQWLASNYPDVYTAIETGVHTLPKEYWFKNMLGFEYPPTWTATDLLEQVHPGASTGVAFESMDEALDSVRRLIDANDRITLDAQATDLLWDKRIRELEDARKAAQKTGGVGPTRAEVAAVRDAHDEARRVYYEQWLTTQREVAEGIERLVNERLVVDAGFMVGDPTAVDVVEVLPRQFIEDYLKPGRNLTDAAVEKARNWKQFFDPINAGTGHQSQEAYEALQRKQNVLWGDAKVQATADTHTALTEINRWFMDHGVTNIDGVPLTDMGLGDMWWRVAQEIDRIPEDARKAIAPAVADLNSWYDNVSAKASAPFTEAVITDADKTILNDYGQVMSKEAYDLVSEAQAAGIKAVNDNLFDYETTQNWMELAGKIYPFVRYPSKNIPYWLNKFTEVPHLSGSVVHALNIQEAYNRDLPARLRRTVKIPSALVDPLLGVLGFDNMELRINPWAFFSFMQQMPGATAFSQQRMTELGLTDASDEQVNQSARIFSIVSEELGFGMWPWLDWALGAQGLLGKGWYPKTALGTWTPTVNWVMRELTDYGTSFDVDRDIRSKLPSVWNYIFGKTPFVWNQMNPDLFQEWAMGREVEGVLWKLPDAAVVALATLNPVQARGIVRGMDEVTLDAMRAAIRPLFDMTPDQQALAIPKLTPEEQAVFMDEVEKLSLRIATRKAAMGNLMGNMLGLYANITDPAEVEARQQRMDRRVEQSRLPAGQERRDYTTQWYEDHPKYQLIQTWRFSEHPWAETAVGKETELWDSTVSAYKDEYFEYSRQWKTQLAAAIEDTYRKYPGDAARLQRLERDYAAQKTAYIDKLNTELNAEMTRRMAAYIETYPNDKKGAQILREGWDTNIYVPVQMNASEQSQLDSFMRMFPNDEKGYADLYERLYTQAQARVGMAQLRHVSGLNEGLKLDLQFSPVGNANYSAEEVRDFLIGDVLSELDNNMPKYGDFEDYDSYDNARLAFFDDLPARALETDIAKKQVQTLMAEQRMTQAEAETVVRSWYTSDELLRQWRVNDTVWDALDYVYDQYYIGSAQREYFDTIVPLKETDYDQYAFLNADLAIRYPAVEAQDLVSYIMEDYSGKWTLAELDSMLEGVVLPSYQDRRAMDGEGAEAVTNRIWAYYNMLDANQRLTARTAFGPLFQDQFMQEKAEGISIEKLGSWMDALAVMTGDELRWRDLPNVGTATLASSKAEAADYGLPIVSPRDEEEYKYAEQLNRLYWEYTMNADPRADAVGNDPIYDKWFGAASPKSYFWYLYYKYVPPGSPGSEVKSNTIVSMILNKETRDIVASNSDYDRASQFIEGWVEAQGISVEDVGVLTGEYDRVRTLIEAYTAIPRENTEERDAFIEQNPLLKDYLQTRNAATTSTSGAGTTEKKTPSTGGSKGGGSYYYGRGSSGSGSSRVDYKSTWTAFAGRVGQSLTAALRILSQYWSGAALPPEALAYLQKLHAELGGAVSFEAWLDALKMGYAALSGGSSYGGARVPTLKPAPTPTYANVTRGIRR